MVIQPEEIHVTEENEDLYLEDLQSILDLKDPSKTRRLSLAVTLYLARFLRENPGYALGLMPIKEAPNGHAVQDHNREVYFMQNAPLDNLLAFADPEPAEQVSVRRDLLV